MDIGLQDWNLKQIEKNWKKLQVPKKFATMRINAQDFIDYDYNIALSIREMGGKTTQALLFALCCWWSKEEKLHIQYERSDDAQITLSKVQTLFDVIRQNGYIERLTDGKYNNVVYKHMEHKFYMANTYTDEKGRVLHDISNDFFMYTISLESWLDYKSTMNDPYANLCIFDEIGDTSRQTNKQMNELCNNISSFGRPVNRLDSTGRPLYRIILLGNNTNKFLHWWEEFCIEDCIDNLKFGGSIIKKTEKGTSLKVTLLANSGDFKDKVDKGKIHFFGFNTPKMNAFTGLQEWQEELYPHLPHDIEFSRDNVILEDLFIYHRNRYIQLRVISVDQGTFIFANYFGTPRNNAIILTLNPLNINEIYGWGDYIDNNEGLKKVLKLVKSNKIYFASNSVGSLFDNFMKEYRKNKLF